MIRRAIRRVVRRTAPARGAGLFQEFEFPLDPRTLAVNECQRAPSCRVLRGALRLTLTISSRAAKGGGDSRDNPQGAGGG